MIQFFDYQLWELGVSSRQYPQLMTFYILITCLLDNVLKGIRRIKMLITLGHYREKSQSQHQNILTKSPWGDALVSNGCRDMDYRSSGCPNSSAGWGHCVVFLTKTQVLVSQCLSPLRSIKWMGTGELSGQPDKMPRGVHNRPFPSCRSPLFQNESWTVHNLCYGN